MPVSLEDVYIKTCLQILPSIAGLVDKAEEHCKTNGLAPESLTEARLAPDMWPFAKQVFQTCHHSARATLAVREGVFGPELDPAPTDFASLRNEVARSIEMMREVPAGELDALAGRDMRFEFGPRRMDFTVEDFLLSFSLPNFYFHATTAYAILRNQGVEIGKRDFIGQVRLKS